MGYICFNRRKSTIVSDADEPLTLKETQNWVAADFKHQYRMKKIINIPSFCIRRLSWPLADNDSPLSKTSLSSIPASLSVQSGGECHLTKSSKIHPGFAA
jgi:hypothetical protein